MTKYKTTRKLDSFNPTLIELVQQAAVRDIEVPCESLAQGHSLKMRLYQIRRLIAAGDHPSKELIKRCAFRLDETTNILHCGLADQDVQDVVSKALKKSGVTEVDSIPDLGHLAEDPYKLS